MDSILKYREQVYENTREFKPLDAVSAIKSWLYEYFESSRTKKVVLGISGGKDSTVVAKILVDVLGAENVFGMLMPNGEQKDIDDSIRVAELLGIKYEIVNIKPVYDAELAILGDVSEEARINIAPRVRMMTLYTYGQTHGYRVAGTGNLSEISLGYFTKFGDGGHDFNIIRNFTSLEVMRIGEELGLPFELVYKTPADGLSGKSDEERLGITYIEMHKYLRKFAHGLSDEKIDKINNMVRRAEHKTKPIPSVDYKYCLVDLPELGESVNITLHTGEIHKAFLTKTSFYDEGVVFETFRYEDIRVDKVKEWTYIN